LLHLTRANAEKPYAGDTCIVHFVFTFSIKIAATQIWEALIKKRIANKIICSLVRASCFPASSFISKLSYLRRLLSNLHCLYLAISIATGATSVGYLRRLISNLRRLTSYFHRLLSFLRRHLAISFAYGTISVVY
jgi:hypothetical protein